MIFLAERQLIELQNFQAEQIGEVMWIAGIGRHVMLIHETRVECSDQRASVLNVEFEAVRFAAGEQMQGWGENQLVTREVFRGARKIHGDIPIVQRIVEKLDVLA